jgi:hypothetical protein
MHLEELCIYVCVCVLHAYIYIIHESVCVHQCAMVMDRLCAHALAGSFCGIGLKPEALQRASPCPSAWTACGFGAQAFGAASAFNANIGAWNTASVTTLAAVCAAPGPVARTMADALGGGFDAARPVVRGSTADARARAHTCRHSFARGPGCRYGRPEGRFHTCIRICIYTYMCLRVLYGQTYIIHLSVYVRIGRGYACVHQCAMVMDRLYAHALAGSCCGSAETRNAEPCEPLPVGVNRVWLRRAGVLLGVGVQREHRRVEHSACHHVGLCMRRSRPGGAHYGGRARPILDAARRVVRGGTADACAREHMCRQSPGRGLGVGMAAWRGGSIHTTEYIYTYLYIYIYVY